MAARWRKQPNETGLRSIGQSPRGFELRYGGKEVITVSSSGGGWASPFNGWYWYWYGMERNTYNEKSLFKTADEAKVDAAKYFASNRLRQNKNQPEE